MAALPEGAQSEESLLVFLREWLVRPEVNDKTLKALIHHLADLDILVPCDDAAWKFNAPFGTSPEMQGEPAWLEKVNHLCRQETGFALRFFLQKPPENLQPTLFETGTETRPSALPEGLINREGRLLADKSSNLSNLQIVKKTGRQLSAFIELENRMVEKLQGPHTTRSDARLLFNFIISQMKEKGTPRPWEQLSRRRHR